MTIEDLSCFLIAGRVKATADGSGFETSVRTPAQGIEDGVEAERIGFRRAFVSERWNLKESTVLLSAVAARTSRIEVGTGLVTPMSRNPLLMAAVGATMHAAHGPRFVLGLGRGDDSFWGAAGLKASGFAGLVDYVGILRRLWAGETVSYDGPAGSYPQLVLGDNLDGPAPQVWFGTFGLPKAAKAAAEAFDGVLLVPNMTPEATAGSVRRIREACERIGRDPDSIHIAQCVITAPELSDTETREIAHARALTYLQAVGYRDALIRVNGWDPGVVDRLEAHPQLGGGEVIADLRFHRSEMLEPAKLVPDAWMDESCALGSIDSCVAQLRRFREAGADEIVTYGSTPGQNAGLAAAWEAAKVAS